MKNIMRSNSIRIMVIVAAIIAVNQLYGCTSKSPWDVAEQAATYEAYQNYIEAIDGQTWYKIRTTDNITGWIYGKFIEEI